MQFHIFSCFTCCVHYQLKVAFVTECRIGTYSIKGESCKECENRFYGKNCYKECGCQNNERCDNVKGCIMLTTTYRFSTTSKVLPEKKDDSKIVFYAGAVGLLVIAFLIGMLVSGIKYKYCSRQRVSEENNDERHYATEESLEMTDQNPGTVLSRLPVPRNFVRHQLNETSENEHKDSIDSRYVNQMEDEGYLNPYQLIQKANIYKHDYMAINAEIPTEKQNDDYLHPYNSLLKHGMSEDHEYRCLRNKNKKIRV